MAGNNPNQAFFQTDTFHGIAKRTIYKRSLEEFIKIELDNNNRIVIVDAIAGKGYYGPQVNSVNHDLKIEKCGSPIIALRLCMAEVGRRQNLLDPPRRPSTILQPQIYLIFNDGDKANSLDLRKTTRSWLKRYVSRVQTYTMETQRDNTHFTIACGSYRIEVYIRCNVFEDLQIPKAVPNDAKWFTIIDAFGSQAIPLDCVERYIGSGK